MVVLIRHGEKEWSNGHGSHDDQPLKPRKSEKKLSKTVENLLDLNIIPKKIITSPYTRCIQTSNIIMHNLRKNNINNVEIIIDNDLGEYIKDKCPQIPKNSNIKASYESKYDLEERINKIISFLGSELVFELRNLRFQVLNFRCQSIKLFMQGINLLLFP